MDCGNNGAIKAKTGAKDKLGAEPLLLLEHLIDFIMPKVNKANMKTAQCTSLFHDTMDIATTRVVRSFPLKTSSLHLDY